MIEMKFKKLFSLLLAGVMAASVAAVPAVSAEDAGTVELTVVTTNDIHGYYTNTGSTLGMEYVAAVAQADAGGGVRCHDHGQPRPELRGSPAAAAQ